MCLLVFAWKTVPGHPLIFAGNRDERHARASQAAGFWPDVPAILAGRDLEAGGTWLGVTQGGRFAVVTNYREGPNPHSGPRSRGRLTTEFLRGGLPAPEYLQHVTRVAHDYAAFSLIVGDADDLWYFSNRNGAKPRAIAPGIHGLSNHMLDTPWPKVTRSKARLGALLEQGRASDDALLALLADRTPAPVNELPDTGIGREREQAISPVFVLNPEYGSRCSSVIFLAPQRIQFTERRFNSWGEALETRSFHIVGDA